MHSLLEAYLSEVSAHLGALPKKRRGEELREMRTHLENAVVVSRERGRSEDEAAASAVAEFGPAQDLGGNVVWAWRRGRTLNRRSFWSAAVSTPLLLLSLWLVMSHNPLFAMPWFNHYCVKHPAIVMDMVQGMFLVTFGLTGLVAGSLFPKRAVPGVGLGLVFFWIGWAADMNTRVLRPDGTDIGWILTALLAAWAGSRSRLAWGRRRRLARN